MQKRILPTALLAFIFIALIDLGCTKLDTTTLAADLVAVDNVHTFADTLGVVSGVIVPGDNILSTQGTFINDSTLVGKNDTHVIGNITTDPIFGTTQASVFVQLKPINFPFAFGNAGDVFTPTSLDSVVLCLSYKGVYGDTLSPIPQTFNVYEVNDANFRDSVDKIRDIRSSSSPAIYSPVVGTAQVTPQTAAQKVVFSMLKVKDSSDHQIRIPLSAAFANRLFRYDSTSAGLNNAFRNDTTFRKLVNGFAVKAVGPGNCLFYVNLAEAKTRLEFFYHKTTSAGVADTVYQTFQMYSTYTTTGAISSTANTVVRNYAGSQYASAATDPTHLFLQASPGTYASLKFPTLMNRPNRIIHRAYLVAEQDPFNAATDKAFTAPPYMYVDLRDSTPAVQYKPIYLDLNSASPYAPDQTSYYYPFANVDPNTFGGLALTRYDAGGTPFTRYEINVTRYIQQLLTHRTYNYDFRLYAPYAIRYPQYPATPISGLGSPTEIPFFNALAGGRVRIGSPTNAAHRLKLIIIYSNI